MLLAGARSLRLLVDGRAAFFVANALVQHQPDQATLPMGNGPDGLVMSWAPDRSAIENLEDTSYGLYRSVGPLIE